MENIHRTEATVIGTYYGDDTFSGTMTWWTYDDNVTADAIASGMHTKYGIWFDEMYVLTSSLEVNGILPAPKMRYYEKGLDYRRE